MKFAELSDDRREALNDILLSNMSDLIFCSGMSVILYTQVSSTTDI